MSVYLNKIASVLAFIIGGMAIFAGGKVLLGIDPGYYVIHWVPVYNYTVAPESIQAMTLRLIVWSIVLGLMYAESRNSVRQQSAHQTSSIQASNLQR